MTSRITATLVAAALVGQVLTGSAMADNQMGYTLLPAAQAEQLSRHGGILGLDVGRAQQITDSGMTFDLLKVNSVRRDSPGDKAGLRAGDSIIAIDGRVFPSVAAFAAYIGSNEPGHRISIDYIPAGGGPQDAQRLAVTLAGGNRTMTPTEAPASTGLSTGSKIAIGVGAAALIGCYKLGCLSRLKHELGTAGQPSPARLTP